MKSLHGDNNVKENIEPIRAFYSEIRHIYTFRNHDKKTYIVTK